MDTQKSIYLQKYKIEKAFEHFHNKVNIIKKFLQSHLEQK